MQQAQEGAKSKSRYRAMEPASAGDLFSHNRDRNKVFPSICSYKVGVLIVPVRGRPQKLNMFLKCSLIGKVKTT